MRGTTTTCDAPDASFSALFQGFLQFAPSPDCFAEAKRIYDLLLRADAREIEQFCFENERRLLPEKRQFIAFNNQIIEAHFARQRPASGLVLLPFCLQTTSCPHRIVWDVSNCKRCGKCHVGEALSMAAALNLPARVAVRGVFAPQFIRESKPELTIAVACEDELFEGILRAAKFKCFGVFGAQPKGYCMNTSLDTSELKKALEYFFGERTDRP